MQESTSRFPSSAPSFGAIVLGALICLAILILFVIFGAGIGLGFNLEQGQVSGGPIRIGAPLFAGIGVIVAFATGGFVAARTAQTRFRSEARLHGLGSWALSVVSAMVFMSSAAGAISKLVLGSGAAAGAAVTAGEIAKQLSDVRIVTDMSLIKGKAVTQFETPGPESAIKRAEKGVKREAKAPKVRSEVKQAAGEIRRTGARAIWLAFVALVVGGLASVSAASAAFREGELSDWESGRSRSHSA